MPESKYQSKNDFLRIKGIGEVTAQVLDDVGIKTYQQLGQKSTAELVRLLKGKISELTLRRIEKDDWPAQARSLIEEISTESNEKTISQPNKETWREVADFFISFGYAIDEQGQEQMRTKVHHSQADKQKEWDGVVLDQMLSWILKQANLPKKVLPKVNTEKILRLPEPSQIVGEALPVNGESVVQMSFSEVQVWTGSAEAVSMKELPGNSLHIETQLTLDKGSLDQTFERAPYSIEIYLLDFSSGHSRLAKSYSSYLAPGQQQYTINQEIGIPEVGRYQLLIFARLLPPFVGIAQAQGPLIRVES